jgi:hypothetical protein
MAARSNRVLTDERRCPTHVQFVAEPTPGSRHLRCVTSTRTTSGNVLAAGTSAGLVTASFLPWSRSGSVRRNSYESAGPADYFGLADNVFLSTMLHAWIARSHHRVVPAGSRCRQHRGGRQALRLPRVIDVAVRTTQRVPLK